MIILKNCPIYISLGVIQRAILTFVSFFILKQCKLPFNQKPQDIYLILPILLTILDGADNIYIKIAEYSQKGKLLNPTNCTRKSKYYQSNDKIIDILSYILCYIYFYKELKDPLLEFFIIYRLIGTVIYTLTYNKYYLVAFFDFVKEYMLYKYFFKQYTYLPIAIILKIIFEYVMHLQINK
jgi:hypothetical protein